MYILDIMKNEYIDVYMKFLEKKNKKYIFLSIFLKEKFALILILVYLYYQCQFIYFPVTINKL